MTWELSISSVHDIGRARNVPSFVNCLHSTSQELLNPSIAGPLYIPPSMDKYSLCYKVWDEITYPFQISMGVQLKFGNGNG